MLVLVASTCRLLFAVVYSAFVTDTVSLWGGAEAEVTVREADWLTPR